MNNREIDLIIKNEETWRRHILKELDAVKKNQNNMIITVTALKIKLGMIGGFFGTVSGIVTSLILKMLSN